MAIVLNQRREPATRVNGNAGSGTVATATDPSGGACGVAPASGGGATPPTVHHLWTLLPVLILVNSVALWGQYGWALETVPPQPWRQDLRGIAVAIVYSGAVEAIGLFLALMAHQSQLANHAYLKLRIGSYAVGFFAGWMNWDHWHTAGTTLALSMGAFSALSPWLWAIYTRSVHRERLAQLGQLDSRAPRFSLLRWCLFFPATLAAFRWAVWHGVSDPAAAAAAVPAPDGIGDTPDPAESLPIPVSPAAGRGIPRADRREQAQQIMATHPDWTATLVAAAMGISERHLANVLR